MDPITFLRLGQIRQQELLDEARRYREGRNLLAESGIATLWQALRRILSGAQARLTEFSVSESLAQQPEVHA